MSDFDHLICVAKQSRENAHAPYSNFRVGAALRASSGRIFGGCNVENATYGLTVCAERIAIFIRSLLIRPTFKASINSTMLFRPRSGAWRRATPLVLKFSWLFRSIE